ncbi:MAG: hypothetical protein HY243_09745 [Proteobacteria bacterium]|nr:hypothetical protein [Pseudomonadota bacterium]
MAMKNSSLSQIGVLLAAALVLSACAGPAVYQAKEPGGRIGYTDERLAPNRYRVTYSGSSSTRRETVEDFLLLRAAQVTLDSGFSYFVFDTRDTEAKTTYYSTFGGWPGWRGYGWYWHNWPFGPPFDEEESRPITRYEAYAEIIMLSDAQAKSEPRALSAHELVDRLGPRAAPTSPSP